MSEEAKAKWRELTAESKWGAVLTVCDRDLMAQYCALSARKVKADAMIAEHGELVAGKDGVPIVNPWVGISDKAWSGMFSIARELGGTPKSRERMSGGKGAEGDKPDEPAPLSDPSVDEFEGMSEAEIEALMSGDIGALN
ncbi:phage terminase small subunit P27 family [Breoghania sp.]|uniref:phage terminase small subunit P27 family n=1 Tax=Breoghania sp. TaxID=2065378 RepID=UPI002AA6440C|nr:phage terminase small subunit P27 family [Breoghania sp.]